MNHAKNSLLFIALSLIVIVGAHYLFLGLQWMITGYQDLIRELHLVFANTGLGNFLSSFLALVLVPLVLSLAIAGIYWCFRRKTLPNFWIYLWAMWLVLATTVIFQG